jgi:hypothetical protein
MTFDIITSTRLRFVLGIPCRKKEFQTCDLTRPFHMRLSMVPPRGQHRVA